MVWIRPAGYPNYVARSVGEKFIQGFTLYDCKFIRYFPVSPEKTPLTKQTYSIVSKAYNGKVKIGIVAVGCLEKINSSSALCSEDERTNNQGKRSNIGLLVLPLPQ